MSGRPKSNTGLISPIAVTASGPAPAAVHRGHLEGTGRRFGTLRRGAGPSKGREGPWEHQEMSLSRGPASGTGTCQG